MQTVFMSLMLPLNIAGQLWSFYDGEIRPLVAPVVVIAFLVMALVNIGKVMGDDRDWKSYLFAVLKFPLILVFLAGLTELVRTLAEQI